MYMVGFMDPARRVPARIKTIAAAFVVLFLPGPYSSHCIQLAVNEPPVQPAEKIN
ncbi:hypothetical protein M405DRAFT_824871 [Rhizopogon salebrosus TDB-379]|nr:hypothetical protein M405DRAFT_824871 [Rhizopogon salebrosus TDB-379]